MAKATIPTYEDMLTYNHGDLLTLQANVERALKETETKNRKSALDELQNRARELGFDLHTLLNDASTKGKGKGKTIAEPKFKDANSDQTWTGRGRKPSWFAAYVDEHGEDKAKSDLAI